MPATKRPLLIRADSALRDPFDLSSVGAVVK
jgi:hypothetical protein